MIALLGNLTRDLLPGQAPRIGGGPYHCARALRRLEVAAVIYARCAKQDRDELILQQKRSESQAQVSELPPAAE